MVVMIHPKALTSRFLLQVGLLAGATVAALIAIALLVWFYLQLCLAILLAVCAYANQADMVTKVLLFILLSIGLYTLGKWGKNAALELFARVGHEH